MSLWVLQTALVWAFAQAGGKIAHGDDPCSQPVCSQDARFFCPIEWETTAPYALAIGDLMGSDGGAPDCWPDVVVVNRGDNVRGFTVFRNNADWSCPWTGSGLTAVATYNLDFLTGEAQMPYGIALGDLDNDGDLDVVLSLQPYYGPENGACKLAICPNVGNGVFVVPDDEQGLYTLDPGSGAADTAWVTTVAIHDLDGNGWKDIVVGATRMITSPVYALFPRVEIVWRESPGAVDEDRAYGILGDDDVPTGNASDITLAKFKAGPLDPEDRDIVASVDGSSWVLRLKNNGNRSFDVEAQEGVRSNGITSAAFRPANDYLDISTVLYDPGWQDNDGYAHFNDGDANFTLQTPGVTLDGHDGPWDPRGMASGIVDPQDNHADVAIAMRHEGPYYFSGCVTVMLADVDANGTFSADVVHVNVDDRDLGETKRLPQFVQITDMDGDLFNDLVVSVTGSGCLSVVLNAYEDINRPGGH